MKSNNTAAVSDLTVEKRRGVKSQYTRDGPGELKKGFEIGKPVHALAFKNSVLDWVPGEVSNKTEDSRGMWYEAEEVLTNGQREKLKKADGKTWFQESPEDGVDQIKEDRSRRTLGDAQASSEQGQQQA